MTDRSVLLTVILGQFYITCGHLTIQVPQKKHAGKLLMLAIM